MTQLSELLEASRRARSACRCGTKEHAPIWHQVGCRYRAIEEAIERMEASALSDTNGSAS